MAKKKVTKKKTRTTAGGTRAPATKKSKKKKTSTTRKTKTTRKPAAKVAKKPSKKKKKTAAKVTKKPVKKKTIRAPKAAATTSRKKMPTTAAQAGGGSRKTTSKSTSRSTSRPRSRSAASVRPLPDANGYVIINGRRVRMMSVPAEPAPTPARRSRGRTKPNLEPVGRRKPANVKTKLGRKDLENYRGELLIRRAELVGDLSAMEAQALRSGGGSPSHMPIHMADVGTDTFDQDFILGMAENERQRLREIDAALKRIEDRTYGICEMTHKVIPKSRLNAKPWARYTIESARQVERGLGE